MKLPWTRWVISAAAGVAAGIGVAVAWSGSGESADPMLGVPPAGDATATTVQALETDPVFVDPDLTGLLSADDMASLHDEIAGYELPTYVAVVRTAHDDGWNSFLPPRILRIADEIGTDGVYLAVDQTREASVAFVHDGAVVDFNYVYLDEGSLGPALHTAIADLHDDEENGGYAWTVQWREDRFTTSVAAVIGGAVLGVIVAVTAYGLLMLVVGSVRAARGLPFRPPRSTTRR